MFIVDSVYDSLLLKSNILEARPIGIDDRFLTPI